MNLALRSVIVITHPRIAGYVWHIVLLTDFNELIIIARFCFMFRYCKIIADITFRAYTKGYIKRFCLKSYPFV